MERRFYFLMSSERSGSNLVTRLMDCHPKICGPAPSHLIRAFAQNIENYGILKYPQNWKTLTEDVSDYLKWQLGEWETTVNRDELLNKVTNHTLPALIRYIYSKEAAAHHKQHLFIKENKIYNFSDFIINNFPDAKFLYLVRDPRDMALSWKLSKNHPGGVKKASVIWRTDQENYYELYRQKEKEGNAILVKYEDLITKPQLELEKVLAILDLKYNPRMLKFHQDELTLKNAGRLRDWSNLKKPVLESNFNKYRQGLSEAEIKFIESYCKTGMDLLKYKRDYPLEKIGLLINKISKIKADKMAVEQLSKEEQYIREKRIKIIKRIINRNLN